MRCLTWYHVMNGRILIRSIMLWNHIACTRSPMGRVAPITGHNVRHVHDNAITSGVIIATRCSNTTPGTLAIQRQHCFGNEKKKLKQQSTVNTEAPKTTLKYYEEFFLLNLLTITSLIQLCDQTVNVWSQVETIWIRNLEERRSLLVSHFTGRWSTSKPHLRSGSTFRPFEHYRYPGIQVLVYRATTIGRFLRRVVPQGRNIIFRSEVGSNHHERLDLVPFRKLRPRGLVLG